MAHQLAYSYEALEPHLDASTREIHQTNFWLVMKKGGGGKPKGELVEAIGTALGSAGAFKEKLTIVWCSVRTARLIDQNTRTTG